MPEGGHCFVHEQSLRLVQEWNFKNGKLIYFFTLKCGKKIMMAEGNFDSALEKGL